MRKYYWAIVLLVITFAGIVYATNNLVSKATVTMRDRPIGAEVAVSGEKVPVKIKATATQSVTFPNTNVVALGSEVDITPGGILDKPITLKFKLNKQVGESDTVVIATRETPEKEWKYLNPEISEDGFYASITTDHLSLWRPLQVVVDFGREFKQEFINSLTGGLTETADKPNCEKEIEAREMGYEIESSHKDTLYWCFGIENGKRVLKVVNRKRYPLDIIHPGLEVKHPGDTSLDLRQLVRLVSGEYTILFPHDEAVFWADIDEGATAGIRSDFSWNSKGAIYLDGLQTSLEAVGSMVVKTGIGTKMTKEQKYQALNSLAESADCTTAIAKAKKAAKSVDFLTACLGADSVREQLGEDVIAFSWLKKLMSPVAAGGSLINWFAGVFSGYIDEEKEKSDYYVMINRKDPQKAVQIATASATFDITGRTVEPYGDWCPQPTPGGNSIEVSKYWVLCGIRSIE